MTVVTVMIMGDSASGDMGDSGDRARGDRRDSGDSDDDSG
jgi:hypothetical protein